MSSNYPPGVTGSEPQITGEWPCVECDGAGGERDEDGAWSCERCGGTGIEPEDLTLDYLSGLTSPSPHLLRATLSWFSGYGWSRHRDHDRPFLREWARLRRLQ